LLLVMHRLLGLVMLMLMLLLPPVLLL